MQRALDCCEVAFGREFFGVRYRHVLERRLGASEIVQKLVPRDRMDPGRERAQPIVGIPVGMNRDQRFLPKVFCFCWTMPNQGEAIAVISAQVSCQSLEKSVVRCSVAIETGGHWSS